MKASEVCERDLVTKLASHYKSAKNRGIECKLTFSQFVKLFQKYDVCGYSGQEYCNINDISIERLDPDLPYSVSNCKLVKTNYNTNRGDIDRFIRNDNLTDEAKIVMMKDAIKVIRNRIKEKNRPDPTTKQGMNRLCKSTIRFTNPDVKTAEDLFEGAVYGVINVVYGSCKSPVVGSLKLAEKIIKFGRVYVKSDNGYYYKTGLSCVDSTSGDINLEG